MILKIAFGSALMGGVVGATAVTLMALRVPIGAPVLSALEVAVPDHTEGETVRTSIKWKAPSAIEAMVTRGIRNSSSETVVPGCSASTARTLEGSVDIEGRLYQPGCALKPGRYVLSICYLPGETGFHPVCARSNEFSVQARRDSAADTAPPR